MARIPEGQIEALRFVIAVHPTHGPTTFERQQVPAPYSSPPKSTQREDNWRRLHSLMGMTVGAACPVIRCDCANVT